MAAVRRRQRRRTWLTAGVAAAAAAAVTVGGAVLVDRPSSPPAAHSSLTPPGTPLVMKQVGRDHMTATVALTSVAWGTRLDLACTYPMVRGDYEAGAYALVVHTTDGRTQRVATWNGLPGRAMQVTAATAARASDIRSVEVTRLDGSPVLRTAV